ncbi:rab gdp/gtp exchange factor [Anaeramoeba flamelloides]|uniref:Rab gdp/gtp exchange factor n=1 Tax=Anaeramoeba flamelloides TaxID=1746091 RepID=A0ABQ8XWA6_9EUKA|nr:rab gdp/gtp exchange factor [Anaeramoeba flamelloides]
MKKKKTIGDVLEAFPKETEKIIKEAERKLRRVLCDIDLIMYNTDKGFLETLYHEMFAAKSTQSISLACLLDSTIKTLESLPSGIKNNEFRTLIWKIKEKQKIREKDLKKIINQKYEFQNAVKDLKESIGHIEEKMKGYENLIKSLLSLRFIEKNQEKLNKEMDKFKNANSKEVMENVVKNFFKKIKRWIKLDTLCLVYEDSYQSIIRLIQNYVFLQIFDNISVPIYSKSLIQKLDQQFSMKLVEVYTRITSTFLNIPKKLWAKEIWIFAINQLSCLNKYKTPLLKLNCLVKCSKIINNIIAYSGFEKFGADLVLPIIIYLIIISNPPDFPSNILFLDTFLDQELMERGSEYWFTMFKSAYNFCKNLDLNKLPREKLKYQSISIW